MSKKVVIVGGHYQTSQLFSRRGWTILSEDHLEDADLVCFTGGADVDPKHYNSERHPKTFSSPERDTREIAIYDKSYDMGKAMVGICRGGQLLNVMAGGSMYQHCTGHASSHNMVDLVTGRTFYATSTHHQIMKPGLGHVMLGVASVLGCMAEYMEDGKIVSTKLEEQAEAVFYPSTRALCFQPHPETHVVNSDCWQVMADIFFNYIDIFLMKKETK